MKGNRRVQEVLAIKKDVRVINIIIQIKKAKFYLNIFGGRGK
jgi:hypothetical protein